jgi:hypothetical protein
LESDKETLGTLFLSSEHRHRRMPNSVRLLSHPIIWATLACACGATNATPPPATAHEAPAKVAADEPKDEPKNEPKEEANDAATPTEKDPREEGLRKASRPPAELITGPNLVYVFNFKESEVGVAAKERCTQENQDPGAVGACLQKARSKVPVESWVHPADGDPGS